MKIEIDSDLFWKIHQTLEDAEHILWVCDGATNPEDEQLTEDILECHDQVSQTLTHLQDTIKEKNLVDTSN